MIVLDSSFLIAYHNINDVHHAAAARTMIRVLRGDWGRAGLLEYVFLEVVTVLLARRGRDVAKTVGAQLLRAKEVDFLPCSDFFSETLATFTNQAAANLSFVDAAIATIALREGGVVATFDRDFRGVEGITVVPE